MVLLLLETVKIHPCFTEGKKRGEVEVKYLEYQIVLIICGTALISFLSWYFQLSFWNNSLFFRFEEKTKSVVHSFAGI